MQAEKHSLKCLVVVLLLAFVGCDRSAELTVDDQSVRPARVLEVKAGTSTTVDKFVARIEAARSVDVSFEVGGPLVDLPVREGQTIARGDLVAALDPRDFDLAVREAQVQVQLALADLERKRSLLNQSGIARSIVDDAVSMHELARVRLAQARESRGDSQIVAPFDAYVARRYLDDHAIVKAGDPIARLNDLHELLVVVSLPERLLATLTTELVVDLYAIFPFAPDRRFVLTYRENRGEADSVAKTYEVTLAMPRPDGLNILPGMTASVELKRRTPGGQQYPIIPTSALVTHPDKSHHVWIFNRETGAVSPRQIVIGSPGLQGIPVKAGLQEGDYIVTTGANRLQAGMRITPMDNLSGR
jgi:RND family efflux transporter MFP subunit